MFLRAWIMFLLEMIVEKAVNIFKIFHARLQMQKSWFEIWESFSNHVSCLSMLDCEVLSYHFKSIYY
jgi:hypothetical protein